MQTFKVTRAHLRAACYQQNWDLLDKLLELDASLIDDAALFTDGWGEWWGLLMDCVLRNRFDGVRVLISRGAKCALPTWGDSLPLSPLEAAKDKPEILSLLQATVPALYVRCTDPPLPAEASEQAALGALDRQAQVRDLAGVVFPADDWVSEHAQPPMDRRSAVPSHS